MQYCSMHITNSEEIYTNQSESGSEKVEISPSCAIYRIIYRICIQGSNIKKWLEISSFWIFLRTLFHKILKSCFVQKSKFHSDKSHDTDWTAVVSSLGFGGGMEYTPMAIPISNNSKSTISPMLRIMFSVETFRRHVTLCSEQWA